MRLEDKTKLHNSNARVDLTIVFYCLYFIVFSFCGWIGEGIVYACKYHHGFVNRGVLFGPWLPVYGFGGMLIFLLLGEYRKRELMIRKVNVKPIICFLLIMLISAGTELITSYVMEWRSGSWLWNYSNDIPNFQGRISLKTSLLFGGFGMIGLYLGQPLLEVLLKKWQRDHPTVFNIAAGTLLGLFALDVAARIFLGSNYTGP